MCSDAYTTKLCSFDHNKEKTSHKEMCSDVHSSSDVDIRVRTPHIEMCLLTLLIGGTTGVGIKQN